MTSAVIEDVIFRLKELESMTWTEIEQGTHSHFVEVTKLIPDAQKRLSALRLDDFDVLFSLRIKAKPRLWGIRINNIFHALWWDPDHQVCPSLKKHT